MSSSEWSYALCAPPPIPGMDHRVDVSRCGNRVFACMDHNNAFPTTQEPASDPASCRGLLISRPEEGDLDKENRGENKRLRGTESNEHDSNDSSVLTSPKTKKRTCFDLLTMQRPVAPGEYARWDLPDDDFLLAYRPPNEGDRADVLQGLHCLPQDLHIRFVELDHTYYWKGTEVSRSVTKLLEQYQQPFDALVAISKMKGGRNWEEKQKEFLKPDGTIMDDAAIADLWKRKGDVACKRGTLMHYTIEQFLNGRMIAQPSPEFEQYLVFEAQHIRKLGYVPYRTELSMYYPLLDVAGQADLLAYHEEKDTFAIYDWKRTEFITYENIFQRLAPPLSDLDDCKFNKFALQLNLYRHILESECGITIDKLCLGVFHAKFDAPRPVEIPIWKERIEDLVAAEKARRNDLVTK